MPFPAARLIPALFITAAVAVGSAWAVETPPPAPLPAPLPATLPAPKAYLGVITEDGAPGDAAGLPITEVKPMSTAASLGLEAGDRLTKVNGKPVKSAEDLQKILSGSAVGDALQVEYTRGGNPQTAKGTMLARAKPQDLPGEVANVQRQIEEVRRIANNKAKEPSLTEILQQVKDLEEGLPKAVAAFKKQYPDGTFDVRVSIIISTDKNAKTPVEFTNVKEPAHAEEKKPEATPETKKPDVPPTK